MAAFACQPIEGAVVGPETPGKHCFVATAIALHDGDVEGLAAGGTAKRLDAPGVEHFQRVVFSIPASRTSNLQVHDETPIAD